MSKLVFLILAFVALSQALPRRNLIRYPHRIVGGTVAEKGSVPHQISLQMSGSHICGGSIINDQWIVTAAHCAELAEAADYSIRAGLHNVRFPEEDSQLVQVALNFYHEDYDGGVYLNDVAVMKLATPLNLGEEFRTRAIELAATGFSATGNCNVTGWGRVASGGALPAELRTVTVPIVSDAVCNERYNGAGYDIYDSMICAGIEEGGKDSCQGDSGGPLVVDGPNGPILSGIVSWGIGCAEPDYPGVYTEVAYFTEWINAKIAANP